MKNNKKQSLNISVVIPCFNAAQTIIATIDSVLAQTLKPQQIIIVDDGASDGSAQLIWEYREVINDSGIKLFLISQDNAGVSAARNRGVLEVKGDLIAFLDADDLWRTNKLEEHHNAFVNNSNLGISFARCEIFNPKAGSSTISSLPVGKQSIHSVFSENPTTTSSNLVVRKALFTQLKGFDESMSFAEDQEFIVRTLATTNFLVEGINKVLVDYMTSENGLSAQLDNMYQGWLFMVSKVSQYAPRFVEQQFNQANARYCYYLARRNLRLNANARQGWNFSKQALLSDWKYAFHRPLRTFPVFIVNFFRQCLFTQADTQTTPS